MSTRCCVEIYNTWGVERQLGAMLYHHSDGYPDFMQGKLERFLKATYEYLAAAGFHYWWDAERVAAVMIALSIEDYRDPLKPFSTERPNKMNHRSETPREYRPNAGVPVFQPCLNHHGDIEYVWKVILKGEIGEFEIEHEHV